MRLRTSKARLHVEPLEDRTLLSTCHVTRLTDQGGGMGFRGDLRYCINKVNANPGADIIDFRVTGTIQLTAALPNLASDIDIQGDAPGPGVLTISAFGVATRIFTVSVGATVAISDLAITDGGQGGDGGGVYNAGTLTLDRVHIFENGATGNGGGIYNDGTLAIYDSTIEKHTYSIYGGGIFNTGTLSIYGSTLSGNKGLGGAIFNAGTLTLDHTVLSDNESNIKGGAIYSIGTMSMSHSSVFDNQVSVLSSTEHSYGGGIFNDGMMWIDSSTIAGNAALSFSSSFGYGGGICNYTHGTMVLRNSTVANNTARFGGGGIMSFGPSANIDHSTVAGNDAWVGGGLWSYEDFTTTLRNTIVATNTADESELGEDVIGQFVSAGHNLIGNSNQGGGFASTDLLDVDPMLSSLADNGGPTLTMALLVGSPAIDAGDNTGAPAFDQRGPGFPRIVNGSIDIGSFEVQASPMPSMTRPGFDLSAVVLATADFDLLT